MSKLPARGAGATTLVDAAGELVETAVLVPLAVRGIHLVVMGQLAVMSLLFLVSIRLSATHSERPTDDRVPVPSSAQRR